MKINEIIKEGKFARSEKRTDREDQVFHVGNEKAKISRTSKAASKNFKDADKGAIDGVSSDVNLKKVRDMYGVQIVNDFVDVLELPNNVDDTDKEMSMFSKDMRK